MARQQAIIELSRFKLATGVCGPVCGIAFADPTDPVIRGSEGSGMH
jgi:hypothetical protein